jgi:hypothetical protein
MVLPFFKKLSMWRVRTGTEDSLSSRHCIRHPRDCPVRLKHGFKGITLQRNEFVVSATQRPSSTKLHSLKIKGEMISMHSEGKAFHTAAHKYNGPSMLTIRDRITQADHPPQVPRSTRTARRDLVRTDAKRRETRAVRCLLPSPP